MSCQFVALLSVALAVTVNAVAHSRIPMSSYNVNYLPRQISTPYNTASISLGTNPPGATTAAPVPHPNSSSNSVTDLLNTITSTAAPLSTASIIHITALPPSTSTSIHVPLRYHKKTSNSVNILLRPFVIAPISAVFGLINGAISAWCYFKLRRYCRRGKNLRARSTSLEPGPPYTSIHTEAGKYDNGHQMCGSSINVTLYDGGSPSKHSVHGSAYKSSRGGLWLERRILERSQQPGSCVEGKALLWPVQSSPAGTRVQDDDPFLTPLSRCVSARTAETKLSFRSAHENTLPYNASAHGNYKRGILENLKFGTLSRGRQEPSALDCGQHKVQLEKGELSSVYTPSTVSSLARSGSRMTQYSRHRDGHKRSDSDLNVNEVRRPEKTYSPAASPRKKTVAANDVTQWVAGRGFRLVEEDPGQGSTFPVADEGYSPIPLKGSVDEWLFGINSSNTPSSQSLDNDKYTILPVRKTPTKAKDMQSTPILSNIRQGSNTPKLKMNPLYHSRVDSSILPLSPPQLLSPPLKSQLLFCSPFIPPSNSIPLAPRIFRPQRQTLNDLGNARPAKETNDVPSPSPFASSPESSLYHESPFANERLTASFLGGEGRESVQARALPESPSSKDIISRRARGTSTAVRQSAYNKVDRIMLKSWSERDSSGMGAAHPTMSGAIV